MQKKIFIALLCLLLSACSTSPSLTDKQVADNVIEALVANDMKTVRSYFNNDMKEKLTEKLLSDNLDDILMIGITKLDKHDTYEVYIQNKAGNDKYVING